GARLKRMPGHRKSIALFIAIALMWLLTLVAGALAQSTDNPLEQGFKQPPDSAKPRTWWHWTSSNVTKEGITKDLEWMKRAGIAGFQLADVNAGGGQTVEKKIVFGTPEWLDAVRHAASEADRLSLEMTIFSSAGWSETGGPWVRPEQAMKKLVWSETTVAGPRSFAEKLPPPPSNNGPIRNLIPGTPRPGSAPPRDPTYYGDSAVIAYRRPPDELNMADAHPQVRTQAGAVDAQALWDDDLNTALTINAPADGSPAWIQFEFAAAFKARAFSIAARGGIPVGRLLVSDDGVNFRALVLLPGTQNYRGGAVRTFAFPETSARFYRLELTAAALTPALVMSQVPSQPAREYVLTEAVLFQGGRVHRWEEKAGFSHLFEYESTPTPSLPMTATIRRADIVDLTSKMDKDGKLNWDVPAGRWTILRLGYSLTGAKNRPAVPAGLGYEVDKLSPQYLTDYLRGYTDPLAQSLGALYGKSLRYVLLDSWEAGTQNWTDEMIAEFQKRRGYDPRPYLPVLAGRVVESAEVSDRFLWDFRRTLADMFAANHYGVATEFIHRQGLQTYGEAAGVSLEIPEDTLLNKKNVDIPMGEFWMRDLHPPAMYYQDVRGAASAAHVYGKPIVATESFTGGGYESPYTLKKVADYWFAQGVNRIIFHTSAHQPLDTKPGNTMVGTHINRNITWAEQSQPFMTYLARNSFMLQQGLPVADLAYLLNEGAPSTMPFWGAGLKPSPPEGYDYDYINSDVLLNRMSVDAEGRLVLPDGMSYRVLVLPEIDRMTLPVLRKLRELVAGGATVLGPRPVKSPSLAGYPESDAELQAIANELWGDTDGISRTRHGYGKGQVVWGQPLSEVLTALRVSKDVECSRALDASVPWIHRRAGEADIYFIVNRSDQPHDIEVRFRVAGKEAELWHPDTGAIEPASYTTADGRTTVPLHLSARESVFVVFRRSAATPARTVPAGNVATLASVDGPWAISFTPNLGAPAKIELAKLESWTANADQGVKYFSGAATYTRTIQAARAWFRPGVRIMLDLGVVNDLAEVSINGKAVGALWKAPYAVDVTQVLKPGNNQLEIKVTNEWTNRLIGDRALPADKKILSAPPPPPGAPATPPPLVPSGLLGPVTIVSVTPR
ncbi:MAG TPA: glycosyl hydrolase, partial [Pyrinomonadaceae bacterium]|nr:glycosyl hydrolase [Pyrinomonadaceae bacterium]